ncbi:hypothetical protein CRU98_02140 [Arcobacter sp. CECT 8986]|uniref:hypothetical protein n=1 Tax=Arcobacter sp. CECT 8986 TaxID=2044507 RepID=UPI00100986F3|nr:hypothetical protein [Arcobacter sp. CECT 8986]RXK01269.1 hypothetical protein CRU98_02140 [Arcobacter sp. CECT 8986]
MKFKNQFEKVIYDIVIDVFGGESALIEHNKVIYIEDKMAKSTISFAGPPKKEIDVLSVTISKEIKTQLLISCKEFKTSKAEPAHVQEWCSVVSTMNKHAVDSNYIGIVISSSGFSSGCEGWASSENIALIPPLKGTNIKFSEEQVLRMFRRVCIAIFRRLKFPFEDLIVAPNFFDFCFTITSDFEGFVGADTSSRYKKVSKGWNSNFSELVNSIIGRKIESIYYSKGKFYIILDENFLLSYSQNHIEFGEFDKLEIENDESPLCKKNINNEDISFESVRELIIGAKVTSAADFQEYIELGIDGKLNLGLLSPKRIHVMIFDETKDWNK